MGNSQLIGALDDLLGLGRWNLKYLNRLTTTESEGGLWEEYHSPELVEIARRYGLDTIRTNFLTYPLEWGFGRHYGTNFTLGKVLNAPPNNDSINDLIEDIKGLKGLMTTKHYSDLETSYDFKFGEKPISLFDRMMIRAFGWGHILDEKGPDASYGLSITITHSDKNSMEPGFPLYVKVSNFSLKEPVVRKAVSLIEQKLLQEGEGKVYDAVASNQ